MLEAVNVSKSFEGKSVIRAFSAKLEKGRRYSLMGPSGCGKTTLLHLLMGLIKPDSGAVHMPGSTRLSAVFQEDRLLEQMTAQANVALVSPATQSEIEALLMELGIDRESLQSPVSTFSGGMKRRVALCRALLADYDVLFLDEPYKGLDKETRERVMRIVHERTQGKTVLLVTHDREETQGYEPIVISSHNRPANG